MEYLKHVSIILTFLLSLCPRETQPSASQVPTETPQPWVQVSSATVEPSAIHKMGAATLIVQILLWGEPPPDPEIRLEVGTFSSQPPDITVKYDKQTRSIRVHKGVNVVKIALEGSSDTRKGTIRIKADVMGATKGLNIKPPDSPANCTAELKVVD